MEKGRDVAFWRIRGGQGRLRGRKEGEEWHRKDFSADLEMRRQEERRGL